jgi:hypothetical protein
VHNSCKYCGLVLSRGDAVKRHMNKYCKKKKLEDDEKNRMEEKIEELKNKMELIIKQEEEKKLKEVKPDKRIVKKNVVTNNSVINNNIVNNNNIILPHNSAELFKLDLKTIIEHLATQDFKSIIPNITKLIYINSMKPQNKNFRVVDLARNKCEFYDGKKWITGKTMDELIKIFENVNTVITDPFEEDKIYKTIKFIENNEELRKKSNWINWSKNYCLSLWDENDKENVGKRNDILNEIKLIFYNNRDEILKLDV